MHRQPCRILLAEDDTVDARAFHRAMGKLGVDVPVTVACDGLDAWEILKGQGAEPAFPTAGSMLVLDINMPRMSGLELLRRIRDDAGLADAVVFVMTTSENENDRVIACDLNVAGYILKSDLQPGLAKAFALMQDCAAGREPLADWAFDPPR